MTASTAAVRTPAHHATPATTIGFANIVRSEWTKLRSLRSTLWSSGFVVLTMVGLAVLMGGRWHSVLSSHKDQLAGFDATNTVLSGLYLAEVAIGAIGVLVISGEYGTGMIRASMAAVPQRRALLAAKALVLAGATLVLTEVLSLVSFEIGQALLGARFDVSLGDPGVARAVFGAGLYATVVALLGFGLGATFRHTAGALSAFFGILFALTALADLLPTSWRNHVIHYLPINAGTQIFVVQPAGGALGPWTGLGVFALYAAAALVLGFLLVDARDA